MHVRKTVIVPIMACMGLVLPAADSVAIAGGCRAVTAAAAIDTRDAAVRAGGAVVVETRNGDMAASAEQMVDTSHEIGTLLLIR